MIAERLADMLKSRLTATAAVDGREARGQEDRRPDRERLLRAGDLVLRAPLRRGGRRGALPHPALGPGADHLHRARVEGAVRGRRELRGHRRRRRCASYAAIIVPSGMVSDRLRYTEDVAKLPPATEFLQRAFAEPACSRGSSATACGWSRRRPSSSAAGRSSRTTTCTATSRTWARSTSTRTSSSTATSSPRGPAATATCSRAGSSSMLERREVDTMATPCTTSACLRRPARDRALVHEALRLQRKRVYLPGPGPGGRDRNRRRRARALPGEGRAPPPRGERGRADVSGLAASRVPRRRPRREARRDGGRRAVTLGPLDFGDFIPGMRVAWISDPKETSLSSTRATWTSTTPPPLTSSR